MDTKGDYQRVSDDDDDGGEEEDEEEEGYAIAYATQQRAPTAPRGDGLFAAFASKPGMCACAYACMCVHTHVTDSVGQSAGPSFSFTPSFNHHRLHLRLLAQTPPRSFPPKRVLYGSPCCVI